MDQEAVIVMLAYVVIGSIFVLGALVFAIMYSLKSFLIDINRFVKTVILLYESEKEEAGRHDPGGTVD